MLKLWRVEIEYTGYVIAETEEDAIDSAGELLHEDPDREDATEVTITGPRYTSTLNDYRPYYAVENDEVAAFIEEHFPPDMKELDADNVTVEDWLKYLKYTAEQAKLKAELDARQGKLPEIG